MSEPLNETLNAKNIHSLHEVAKRHEGILNMMIERLSRMENEIVNIKADISNTKHLMVHLNHGGIGMGPTVNG